MAETLSMRTIGGPWAGTRLLDTMSWPLPDTVPDPEERGEYVKVSESQLPGPAPGIVRGAEYEWRAFDPLWEDR
jgi:hypothetical protein